jgi:hypothetical protein
MKRVSKPRLVPGRRPEEGVGEWLAAMVRGLDALEFLERSRDVASEAVVASPMRLSPPAGTWVDAVRARAGQFGGVEFPIAPRQALRDPEVAK